jgi:precorrin-2 dehydrogenase/sirohydrochlorin ferrochelatase
MSSGPHAAYPVVLTGLADSLCTVVGGGEVAQRKIEALTEAGAERIRVVAPEVTPCLERLRRARRLEHLARPYLPGDLDGSFLVIAATDDPRVNRAVAAEAGASGVLVNVVDAPELGNFTTPASVRRGDLLLAISTGGTSPALAARIRRDLEQRYGAEFVMLLNLLRRLRPVAATRLTAPYRRCFWRSLSSRKVLTEVRSGRMEHVEDYAEKLLAQLSISSRDRVEDGLAHATADTGA